MLVIEQVISIWKPQKIEYNLGLLHQRSGKHQKEAVQAYKRCLEYSSCLISNNCLCHLNLGVIYEQSGFKQLRERAAGHYQKCLEEIKCKFNLARLHYQSGNFQTAIELFPSDTSFGESSFSGDFGDVSYDSTDKASFTNLAAMSFYQLGNFTMAERLVRKSLRLNPNHQPALKLLSIISQRKTWQNFIPECLHNYIYSS